MSWYRLSEREPPYDAYERNDGTWRTMNDASDIDSVTCPACLRVYMERRG